MSTTKNVIPYDGGTDLLSQIRELQIAVNALNVPGPFENAIDALVVKPSPGITGNVLTFKIVSLGGVDSIGIFRGQTRDFGSASLLNTLSLTGLTVGQQVTFNDNDPLLATQTAFYWAVVYPAVQLNETPITNGPVQVLALTGPAGTPLDMAFFFASKSPGAGGVQPINVAFLAQPFIQDFGSAKIYISGYLGVAAKVAIAQNFTSPFRFNLQQTGEVITLYCVTVLLDGTESPLASAPFVTLTLDGNASVPNPLVDLLASALTTGVQLNWTADAMPQVLTYKVYRGPYGGGFGAASQIATVNNTGLARYNYLDVNGLTDVFEWYIVTHNAVGDSAPTNAVNVQAFLASSQIPPNNPINSGNQATVDSIDAGADATIRIYGTGGPGTSWVRTAGYGTHTYPTGTILHQAYGTMYRVYYDGTAYHATTNILSILPDNFVQVGTLTTVNAGGGGGSGGGGGGSGGGSGGKGPPWYD